jgi:hypothetical protein
MVEKYIKTIPDHFLPQFIIQSGYNSGTLFKKYASMNQSILEGQILIPFTHSSFLLPDDSNGTDARELWWTNQEFSPASITIPP